MYCSIAEYLQYTVQFSLSEMAKTSDVGGEEEAWKTLSLTHVEYQVSNTPCGIYVCVYFNHDRHFSV